MFICMYIPSSKINFNHSLKNIMDMWKINFLWLNVVDGINIKFHYCEKL